MGQRAAKRASSSPRPEAAICYSWDRRGREIDARAAAAVGASPPTLDEALAITKIYDLLFPGTELARRRPFRAPTTRLRALGSLVVGPISAPARSRWRTAASSSSTSSRNSRATRLEALRQPLEEGRITLGRAAGSLTFPSRFQLIGAMNPCACGWRGHPIRPCVCLPRDLARYQVRVSGPLLDRIDLFVAVAPVHPADIAAQAQGAAEGGAADDPARDAVLAARDRQLSRFAAVRRGGRPGAARSRPVNSQLSGRALERFCAVDGRGGKLLRQAVERLGLTMRAHARTLRVARTIADFEGKDSIGAEHVAEALPIDW